MSRYADIVRSSWTELTRAVQNNRTSPKKVPQYVYASRWNPCDRAMALDLLEPGDRGEYDDTTLERFTRGDEIERMIVARLTNAGRYAPPVGPGSFRIVGGQERYELHGRDLKNPDSSIVVIVGKTDGKIEFDDGESIPFDVKSGASVQRITSLEQMLEGRWTRGMIYQILAYCYGASVERGFLILDQPSGPRIIEVELSEHLDKMEAFLRSAEIAVHCIPEPGTDYSTDVLPDFTEDIGECLSCDHYKKSCHPPISWGEGLELITDPDIIELADRVIALRELGKEYNSKDKKLKAKIKGIAVGSIGGQFDVTGKWGKSSKTVYPEACPKCSTPIVGEKVTNDQGRWLGKVERTSDET